ncbi:methyltransferase domain-containing protein [Sediminibacillus dalangtanensis]|uniref:Methyltransferase domain-containing protein n=1 Tax=Sediminibacillus dalangtanensis TaxID=2729421 RepID=A0ABX7VQV0_9BACI|nr:methyltransferase domain-containing protein [Sediminibacillus dalangtanensis]QTM99239.1 methyltransferase domain-containing protein [Sediminibacillus dalangtanensis]
MAGELFSYQKADQLLNPEREEWVPIDQVIELLNLQGNEKVIDLGAGNGYLTIPIAEKTDDRVVAVDVQQEMLEQLADRAVDQGLENIDRMPSGIDYLNFPDNSFQRGVAAFVFYEVNELEQALQEIHRVISEDGRLLIIEWEKSNHEEGPPLDVRLPKEALQEKLENFGFSVTNGNLNSNIYYMVAEKVKHI